MKSDPKDCLYCQNNETLHNLMIEIAQLNVSRVFLFKEQTYRGRCLVAYKDHVNDLNELSDEDRNAFMADVARVTRAMQKAFNPEKINYGAYSDKLSHLHFHLAPKYVDGPDYGGTFQVQSIYYTNYIFSLCLCASVFYLFFLVIEIEVEIVHVFGSKEFVEVTPVFLSRASCSFGTVYESADFTHFQQFILVGCRNVFHDIRN